MANRTNQQLDELKAALQRHEECLMQVFVKEGPQAVRDYLCVKGDVDWKLVFDYLVKRKKVLEVCALDYLPFFKDLVVKHGPEILKSLFKIEGKEYEKEYERLFDMIAVSHGAIYQYAYGKRSQLVERIMGGEAKSIRKELCIYEKKYDALWFEVLELLRGCVCEKVVDDVMYERGLNAFSLLMTAIREQKSLVSFRKMWSYES